MKTIDCYSHRSLFLGFMALSLAWDGVPAQAGGTPVKDAPAAAVVVKETEAQTISRCLKDLASKDDYVRFAAVTVLGKYRHTRAYAGVIQALKDKSPRVRSTALVSLTEKRNLPRSAFEPMLTCLGDDDVHVRRIASVYIPNLMQTRRVTYGGQPTQPSLFSVSLRKLIVAAYADSDSTVRKNMIKSWRYFTDFLPPERVRTMLTDKSRDVRILALTACRTLLSPKEFAAAVEPLAKDPDPMVRLRLAVLLGANRTAGSSVVLKILAKDDDFETSTQALLEMSKDGDASVRAGLRKRLDDPRLAVETGVAFIDSLPDSGGGADADAMLRDLIGHTRAKFRQAAYRAAMRILIMEALSDSDPGIRQTALAQVSYLRPMPPTLAAVMAANEYQDVRRRAVSMTRQMSPTEAGKVLMELILDDDLNVRRITLHEIARRRLSGWEKILRQTLDDPDLATAAANMMLGQLTPANKIALAEFAQKTKSAALKRRILNRLRSASGIRRR